MINITHIYVWMYVHMIWYDMMIVHSNVNSKHKSQNCNRLQKKYKRPFEKQKKKKYFNKNKNSKFDFIFFTKQKRYYHYYYRFLAYLAIYKSIIYYILYIYCIPMWMYWERWGAWSSLIRSDRTINNPSYRCCMCMCVYLPLVLDELNVGMYRSEYYILYICMCIFVINRERNQLINLDAIPTIPIKALN